MWRRACLGQGPDVEIVFWFPVKVEWLHLAAQVVIVFVAEFSEAIGGGTTRIDQWNLGSSADFPDGFAIGQIQMIENGLAFLGGVCARA